MSIKAFEFEGLRLRSKVPIPFVEENSYLPERVYIEGYFPVGTICKLQMPICSKKLNPFNEQTNDYCHAVSLLYDSRENDSSVDQEPYTVIFHVDLSALFLLFDPIDEDNHVIPL